MRRLRATLLIFGFVLLAALGFNLFHPPDQDPSQLVPLLQRQGQWPHRHLMGLAPDRRAWVLGQVIESAGHRCEPFTVEFKGLREDLAHPVAYHLVNCSERADYLVALVADEQGSTQVLDCRKAYARKLDCARDWARMPAVPE